MSEGSGRDTVTGDLMGRCAVRSIMKNDKRVMALFGVGKSKRL